MGARALALTVCLGGAVAQAQNACLLASTLDPVTAACCGAGGSACSNGVPSSCSSLCAASFLPVWRHCGADLAGLPTGAAYTGFAATCAKPQSPCPVVIDVRAQSEWDGGHVSCAARFPVQDDASLVDAVAALLHGDLAAPVVTYCYSGARAGRAQTTLRAAGFSNATNGGGFVSPPANAQTLEALCSCVPPPAPGSTEDRALAALVGAMTADAAAMPFHWIYSAPAIARTVGSTQPEFWPSPQCQWYSYTTGAFSPFGQQGMVYLRTLASSTSASADFVKPTEISAAYYAYYGAATGACHSAATCYHDACTRGFVANIAAGHSWPSSGADDDQDEAITHIIPVVALLAGHPSLLQRCKDAIRVVQNTDRAQAFGLAAARILEKVVLGSSVTAAATQTIVDLRASGRSYPLAEDGSLATLLQGVMGLMTTSSSALPNVASSCDYPSPLLMGVHLAARLETSTVRTAAIAAAGAGVEAGAAVYMAGVRENIAIGGDNAGRGQWVGALLSAAGGGMTAVPAGWRTQVTEHADLEALGLSLLTKRASLGGDSGSGH